MLNVTFTPNVIGDLMNDKCCICIVPLSKVLCIDLFSITFTHSHIFILRWPEETMQESTNLHIGSNYRGLAQGHFDANPGGARDRTAGTFLKVAVMLRDREYSMFYI